MSENVTPRRPEIWRDGDHIVSDLRGGYWDRVSNAEIARHAVEAEEPIARAFAKATLAIREFERLAQEERSLRAAVLSGRA